MTSTCNAASFLDSTYVMIRRIYPTTKRKTRPVDLQSYADHVSPPSNRPRRKERNTRPVDLQAYDYNVIPPSIRANQAQPRLGNPERKLTSNPELVELPRSPNRKRRDRRSTEQTNAAALEPSESFDFTSQDGLRSHTQSQSLGVSLEQVGRLMGNRRPLSYNGRVITSENKTKLVDLR